MFDIKGETIEYPAIADPEMTTIRALAHDISSFAAEMAIAMIQSKEKRPVVST